MYPDESYFRQRFRHLLQSPDVADAVLAAEADEAVVAVGLKVVDLGRVGDQAAAVGVVEEDMVLLCSALVQLA